MKTNTYEIPYPSEWGPETITAEAVLARANLIADEALARVITHDNLINAADDDKFRHLFGRDSAICGNLLMRRNPEVVRQTIFALIKYQGVKNDPTTEEEPGKIFHELKRAGVDANEQAVFENLRATQGMGDDEQFLSYTSIDATPEFIHLAAAYVQAYGSDILEETVERSRENVTVEQGLRHALAWLSSNIERSDIGLVGAHRTNPQSVTVADLLDGSTSFMHADGKTLVNHTKEVNTINFQSLAYQAFNEAAAIMGSPEERARWQLEADTLRDKTIEHFWMPEQGRVAMALDRRDDGKVRRLETDTILPAVALRTGIFDEYPDIVEAILKGLYTPDMMTCVGPRTQSLAMDVGYTRYQDTPWPVLVGRVIEGALRYGELKIATDLIERQLMGTYTAGQAEDNIDSVECNKITKAGILFGGGGEISLALLAPPFARKTSKLVFLRCITPNSALVLLCKTAGVQVYALFRQMKKTPWGLHHLAEEGRFELPLQASPY
jgi:glycogen debranching enzyme